MGIVSLDGAGLVREVNATASALLGRPRRTILGMPFGGFVERPDLRLFMEHMRQCRRHPGQVVSELSIRRPAGAVLSLQLLTAAAPDGTRRAALYRTALTDVTELRRAQDALRQSHAELEQRVADRTADLLCANALIREQMTAQDRADAALREVNRELQAEIAERQRLEGEVLEVSERERRGFGQDLHDDICQQLAGLAMMNQALSQRLRPTHAKEAAEAARLAALLAQTLAHTRALARGLHPVAVEANGLMAALQELAAQASRKVPCRLACRASVPVADNKAALHLYRIAQEAVANALKHARASKIVIGLRRQGGKILLSIADDGSSLTKKGGRGMGLHIMPYRARMIGATLVVRSEPGRGTEVVCAL